jgi:transposase-like protein
MAANPQSQAFTNGDAAREAMEAIMWPDGPTCPRCGSLDHIGKVGGASARAGLYYCGECKRQFTVTVGTIFERSKVPLSKWWLAVHLMASSKKGMSAHQLHRMLGVTYQTAWFMEHRIREAMNPGSGGIGPLGGKNKVVEADETYVGGKAKNRKGKVPPKSTVLALVERGGEVRSRRVADVCGKTLRLAIVTQVDRASYLMTDEAPAYPKIGDEFAGHGTVNHSAEEYVRAYFWHTNTVEGYFSILKRGIMGTFHHVGPQHLHHYLAEFDFRYNARSALGTDDAKRAEMAFRGAKGRRLTYRWIGEAANA